MVNLPEVAHSTVSACVSIVPHHKIFTGGYGDWAEVVLLRDVATSPRMAGECLLQDIAVQENFSILPFDGVAADTDYPLYSLSSFDTHDHEIVPLARMLAIVVPVDHKFVALEQRRFHCRRAELHRAESRGE